MKENKTMMMKKVGGRRSIVKDDSKSAATCRQIPEDILIEILVRLPVYSLMKFKCVSRLWSSLISSRYFTNLFFNFSSSTKREPRVFVYWDDQGEILFLSSLNSNLDSTASYPTLSLDLTLPCIKNDRLYFDNAVRGLMCFSFGIHIQIINFTTKQVVTLPLLKSNMLLEINVEDVSNYFGYDSVNDEYKVLSIIATDETKDWIFGRQVFVLGEGASWRNTKSLTSPPPPHHPSQGISINGVLYYGAQSHEERSVVMSFDFSSEEFNSIELPIEYRIKFINDESCIVDLMNYQDQVALCDGSRLNTECILDLWVLEDAGKSKWSHKFFSLPCHQIRVNLQLKDRNVLQIEGMGCSVALWWRDGYMNDKSTCAFYDLENNRIIRSFVVEPPYHIKFRYFQKKLWEEVESIMHLEV